MGGAVAYRGWRQLTRGWRSLLVVALLSGALFGGATAAAAAARRTSSAYVRFTQATNAWEAMYVNYEDEDTAILSAEDLRGLADVESVDEVRYEYAAIGPGTAFLADRSGRLGTQVAEARLLEGRWFDPEAEDEAVISFALAEREDIKVGDRIEPFPGELLQAAETPEEQAFVRALLAAAPGGRIRVVGIAAMAGQFPPLVNPGIPLMQFSPGFAALPEPSPNHALLIQLEEGADVRVFRKAVEDLAAEHGKPSSLGVHSDLARDINRSLRPQVVALAILSIVLALAAAVVSAQAVARQVDLDAADTDALRAIGFDGRDLRRTAALQWVVVGVAAGCVALVAATALSPMSPSGLARIAEPAPGVRLDALALALGAAVSLAIVFAAGVGVTTMRLRRRAPAPTPALATLPLHPVIGIGIRRAFDRSHRVPVWSTVAGATVGIAAVAAALTVGTTLDQQLDEPERYGLRWDLELTQFTEDTLVTEGAPLLAADERLSGVAAGVGGPTPMDGREVNLLAMDPVRGEVRPPLVRGDYPEERDAVALGQRTLEQLGAGVGDDVALDFTDSGGARHSFRVVGVVLMPPQGVGGRMDEGVFFSLAGVQRAFGADEPVVDSLFLAGAPGIDLDVVVRDLEAHVMPQEKPSIEHPTTPSDLVDLGRARSMPNLFAIAMASAGAAALTHTMLVSVRRRRRETAVLRALGFRRGQFYAVGLLQAGTLALVAVAFGILLGVVVGRLAWNALADSIGSSLSPFVPVIAVVVVLPLSVFALVALLAVGPARWASRQRPAAELRSE